MTLLLVSTTVGSADEARRLARGAVEAALAACAQVEPIESVYVWQDRLCQEPEWRVLFKTVAVRYEALEHWLREHHPYELPAVVAVEAARAEAAFAAWVAQGSRGG